LSSSRQPARAHGPRHVLVAGGTGFLGRALVERLLRGTAARITVLSRRRHPPYPDSRVTTVTHDLGTSLASLSLPDQVDVILHCASQRGVSPSEVSALDLFAANVDGTFHLLDYAVRAGASRLVYVSSGGVCGYHRRPLREGAHFAPPTPYLMAKLAGELAVRAHAGVPFTIVRLFFPYGTGQVHGLFPLLTARILAQEPVLIGPRGEPAVNPVYIEDAARYLCDIALDARAPAVVNVAGGEIATMRTLATLVGSALGKRPVFREEPEQRLNLVGDRSLLVERYGPCAFRLAQGVHEIGLLAKARRA
jgi:UDP-glucose 4-epimerase